MKKLFALLALAGVAWGSAAQAQDAAVFRPTGAWTADYGDDYCRLIRTFSDGKDEISLALERTQPGAFVRLIMVGAGVKPFRGADQIGYQLLPSGASAKARYVRSETGDGQQFLSFDPIILLATAGGPPGGAGAFTPPPPGSPPPVPPPYNRERDLENARGINGIALGEGLITPVRIETGSLRAPIAAMQACADDLLKVWGLDPDKHKTMTAPAVPVPNPDGILPQGMIPFTEFGKFGGGANQLRLIIGTDGKPSSCVVYSPSLTDSLNSRICGLVMDKAVFQPAKDAGGEAMTSFWMGPPLAFGRPFGR